MTKYKSHFGLILMAAGTITVSACDVPNEENGQNQEEPAQADALINSQPIANLDANDDSVSPAVTERGSANDHYRLAWSTQARLCDSALGALNIAHAAKGDADASSTDLDYASAQAARYLSTAQNVHWQASDIAAPMSSASEVATFDYFNDGIERLVVRMQGSLAGNKLISLGILESDASEIVPLSFGHAAITSEGLPDTENLHSKLTYSVADVINTDDGYFTLLMPLKDFDTSGRIYLASWQAKDDTQEPRQASDYYTTLSCVFQPVRASDSVSSE